MTDPFVGSLTFARIYSGVLQSGSAVMNTVKGRRERIGRMLLMHANSREDVKEARAGDIVALAGLKTTTTGDTLADQAHPVVLERMEFPEPVIEIAVEPRTKADQEKMGGGPDAACRRGSLASASASDPESGQTIIKGMGELHLEIIIDRMRREFKVERRRGRRRRWRTAKRFRGCRVEFDYIAQETNRRRRPVRPGEDGASSPWRRVQRFQQFRKQA